MAEYKVGDFLRHEGDVYRVEKTGRYLNDIDIKHLASGAVSLMSKHWIDENCTLITQIFSILDDPVETFYMMRSEFEAMRQEIDDMKARLDSHEKD